MTAKISKQKKLPESVVLPHGTTILEKGKWIRVVWLEIADPEKQQLWTRGTNKKTLDTLKEGHALKFPNGVTFLRKDGKLYRVLKQDLTQQKAPLSYRPVSDVSKTVENSTRKAIKILRKTADRFTKQISTKE